MKTIKLSGEIGWDIWPSMVQRLLDDAEGKDIKVEFSSPGGYVFEGLQIHNLFKNYPGTVHFHITGEACSMGSYIVLAGDTVSAEANAVFMIHNARSYASGDHNALRKRAGILEGLSNIIAAAYVKKTGKSLADVKAMMDDESWFFGGEIKDAGFIDEITGQAEESIKAERLAFAQEAFTACVEKMKKEDKPENYEKAAALLTGMSPGNTNIKPRNHADEPEEKKEIVNMDLAQIMAENPAVKAEVERLKQEQYNAGFEAGKTKGAEAVEARIKKATPCLSSDVYPKAVKDLAVKVLSGESEPAALEGALTIYDAQEEERKARAAAGETDGQEETPGDEHRHVNETGAIDSEDSYQATIAQAKKEQGRA